MPHRKRPPVLVTLEVILPPRSHRMSSTLSRASGLSSRATAILLYIAALAVYVLYGVMATEHLAEWTGSFIARLGDVPFRLWMVVALFIGWGASRRRSRQAGEADPGAWLVVAAVASFASTYTFRFMPDVPALADEPLADVFQLSSMAALSAAMVRTTVGRQRPEQATMQTLDAIGAVGGFGLLVWYHVIRGHYVYDEYGPLLGPLVELLYPMLDLYLVVVLVDRWSALRRATSPLLRAGIITAVAGFVLGDLFLSLQAYVFDWIELRHLGDLGWSMASAGLLLAGLGLREPQPGHPDEEEEHRPAVSPIATMAVIGAFASTVVDQVRGSTSVDQRLWFIGIGGLMALLLVRETVGARASRTAIAERAAELDRLVQRRTAELAEANAKLQDLASHDALTGLANRRRLDDVLADAWANGQRSGQSVAVLLLDVDHFKAYNDSVGHRAGDECLRGIGMVLRDEVARRTDLAARYGGEEFAIICASTDREGAETLAHRIVEAIRIVRFPHPSSPTSPFVTVSIGVAVAVPAPGTSSAGIVEAADAALYAAKRAGRDRVAFAS